MAADEHYNVRTVEYAPEEQAPEKAEEMLRSLVFSYVRDAPLETLMAQATRLSKDECEDVMTAPAAKGLVNDYESIFVTRYCTNNRKSGLGEVIMFKLIQGKTAMYLGERTWRIKAFGKEKPPVAKEVYDGWAEYMKAVTVCAVDDAMRPCPKGAAKKGWRPCPTSSPHLKWIANSAIAEQYFYSRSMAVGNGRVNAQPPRPGRAARKVREVIGIVGASARYLPTEGDVDAIHISCRDELGRRFCPWRMRRHQNPETSRPGRD